VCIVEGGGWIGVGVEGWWRGGMEGMCTWRGGLRKVGRWLVGGGWCERLHELSLRLCHFGRITPNCVWNGKALTYLHNINIQLMFMTSHSIFTNTFSVASTTIPSNSPPHPSHPCIISPHLNPTSQHPSRASASVRSYHPRQL